MKAPNLPVATLATTLPLTAHAQSGTKVVIGNDDGWAVSNIRAFYAALNDAGFDTILSAPAENQSGRGSLDGEPEEVEGGCQFGSCPPGSPPTGSNASDPRLNYVNSYPVTAIKHGLNDLAPDFFNGQPPALALTGPNHGSNIGIVTQFSGTVGAAVEAASQGIPAIAFSGAAGDPVPWNQPPPRYSQVYADLALTLTNALIDAGPGPYLPANTWLNVNFPAVNDQCSRASDFTFVLSRIYSSVPLITPPDVETCGLGGRLRSEWTVSRTEGCFVSVSVGDLDKTDAGRGKQEVVLERLGGLLGCLPEDA